MTDLIAQNVPFPRPYNMGINIPTINDVGRNMLYNSMLKKSVKNKVCAEVGFGSGILTLMSLKNGAKKVYAFEPDKATFELGKEILTNLGLSSKIVFINDYFHISNEFEIIVHELMNKNIWGEGLYNIYKQCFGKCKIIPNKLTIELVASNKKPEKLCPDASFKIDTGIDYLKEFSSTFERALYSKKFTSYNNWFLDNEDYIFDRHVRNNNKRIELIFNTCLTSKTIDLNNDIILPKSKQVVVIPDNTYITMRVKLQDNYYLDSGHWNEGKIIHVKNKGEYNFVHDSENGNWWLE
jgi:hypothetical protein